MNRLITVLASLLLSIVAFSQPMEEEIIKFLGIPVDGSKRQMVSALKKQGFTYNPRTEVLTGKFNGKNSYVSISTNKGKVDRVIVWDAQPVDESSIIFEYNYLIRSFRNSGKYYEMPQNEFLMEDENVSYEIGVKHKHYEAIFYPIPNIPEELLAQVRNSSLSVFDPGATELALKVLPYLNWEDSPGLVWFTIKEYQGGYFLAIYYENRRNRPNGEDL